MGQDLRDRIHTAFTKTREELTQEDLLAIRELLDGLDAGTLRSAEPDAESATGWRVNSWVKQGILLAFRSSDVIDMSCHESISGMGRMSHQHFFDKALFPVKRMHLNDRVRVVPGGSSIRTGSYVAPGVVCMPPMYINVGAYVGAGTMVDSHVLVGSCAQIGANVHLSAAVQIGGVLEPIGAMPVIIEDGVMVGGNCGVYEGTVVKRSAVLGTGVILNRSTPVYDLTNGEVLRASDDHPLVIPEGAVVISGSRAVTSGPGKDLGISIYTPVIVKYRDEKTDARVQLEDFLR